MISGANSDLNQRAESILGFSRWWQVIAAGIMMALISPYQYIWSSIEGPLATRLDVSLPALGAVFTLFVIFQAGSQFPVGWWRDRNGPRLLIIVAGILAGGGYVGLAYATEIWHVYLLYSVGAIGVGIVYTVAVNTALKWFPDRRGLTTGIGTMAFAAGSALAVPFVRANATATGYPLVLRNGGILIGIGILVGALVLRDPPTGWMENISVESSTDEGPDPDNSNEQYTWREMIATWQFWVMYGMFVAMSGAGLMVTAKIVSFAQAQDFSANIATVSATVLPVASGVGRLVVGDLSDRLDRERAMAVSFLLCGVGVLSIAWLNNAASPVVFISAVLLATFFWSPQYTLFPSLVGDYYGRKHSSANYALLYSGKMWGGVFGGAVTGGLVLFMGWNATFALGGVFAVAAGIGALFLSAP